MQFLIDAQLPLEVKHWLSERGHDALHTLDLPKQNRTEDHEIAEFADSEGRILISKDRDFLNLKMVKGTPKRLLLVTTGNIRNPELIRILDLNLETITELFQTFEIVEFGNTYVVGKNT